MIKNIFAEIDAEIARLKQARVLLLEIGTPAKRSPGRPPNATPVPVTKKTNRRPMSAEARQRVRQAQLKRWAAKKSNG